MANFALDTTNYSRLTGNQGTGTTLSLDTATGVLWCTEGTNTFSTATDLFHRTRKFYLYDNNNLYRGEAVVQAKLTDDGSEERFALRPRVDANGDTCYFMNDLGECQDPSGTGKQAFTSTWEVDLSGTFEDIPNSISGWTNTNSSLTRSDDGQVWTLTVQNGDITSSKINDSASIIFGANTAGDQRGVAFFAENIEIRIDNQTTSGNSYQNGPFRFSGGTVSFGICDDFQQRKTSGDCLLIADQTATDHSGDKIVFGFDTAHNSSSLKGNVFAWYGGRMWGNSNRQRFLGAEGAISNARLGMFASCVVMNTYINQDIYSGQQGNQALEGATDTNQAALNFGEADRNWLRNLTIVGNAANALPNRWRGNQEGGSLSYYNAASANDDGPLASFGYGAGSGTAPLQVGGEGNTYLNIAQFSDNDDDTNYAFLNRNNGTTYINFTNVNTLDTRGRTGAGSGNVVNANYRPRFQYAAVSHNLYEGTKAFVTYDTNLTGDNTLFGHAANFARPLDGTNSWADTADANGNLTVRITDRLHKASTTTLANVSTDTYGYRYPTDGTDANDEATWAGPVSVSWKQWGFYDIVKTAINRVDKYVSGTRVSSWEISANVDTDSLAVGLSGGAEQTYDPNLIDADNNVVAQTWDGSPIGDTIADAVTALSSAIGTWDGTLNSNNGGYPYFDVNGPGTGDIDYIIDDAGWNDSSNRTHITLDEVYAAAALVGAKTDEDTGTAWNGAKHQKFPFHTVTDNVWDLTTIDNDGVKTDVTSVSITDAAGFDHSWQLSAKNSLIKGIKFDRAKGTFTAAMYDLTDGIILESDVAGVGNSVDATWENTTQINNSHSRLFGSDNIAGSTASNPIGAFTLKGKWELDIADNRTADYNIYFDSSLQDEMFLYADPTATDNPDAQGQLFFNYGGSNSFNINVFGLSNSALVQSGSNKAFRTNSSNVSINFVQQSTLKFVGQSGVTYKASDLNFQAFQSSDGSTFTGISVADGDWDFDTAGEFSITLTHDYDKGIYFALHVNDSDGADGAKSYYIQADENVEGDTDYSITPIANITATSSGLDSVTVDVTKDGSADVDSDTANVVVSLDTTSTTNQTLQQSRYFLQNVAFATDDWLAAVAKGYIPKEPIRFQVGDSVWTDFNTRFSIERKTAGTAATLFLNDIPVDDSGDSLWNTMTSGTAGKEIYFNQKTDGASTAQIEEILNNRYLTAKSVTNLGLGAPVVDSDGFRKTVSKTE